MKRNTVIAVVIIILTASASIFAAFGGGSGTESDPYLIYTADQLNQITSSYWGSSFKLMDDIDLSSIGGNVSIGINRGVGSGFTGTFDGNYKKIYGYNVVTNDLHEASLFDFMPGKIKNLTLFKPSLVLLLASNGYPAPGSFLVRNNRREGQIINCHIEDGFLESRAPIPRFGRYGSPVGGITYSNSGRIIDCSFSGTIVGDVAGGIACENWGNISNTHASGYVETGHTAGLLVGNNRGYISSCLSWGEVFAETAAGGLVGVNFSTITQCCTSSLISTNRNCWHAGGLVGTNFNRITDCYANSYIKGGKYVGGLVGKCTNIDLFPEPHISNCYSNSYFNEFECGYLGGLIAYSEGASTVINSFWDIDTSNQYTSQGGIGKTTSEMQTQSTFTGWDFENIWWIEEGNDYPRLWWEFRNTPPIAEAGANQTIYVFANEEYALVQLDGTGSYDEDGDALEYYWYNDANELIQTGAEPNVLLPVGEHEITLIVNDGTEDSEPNSCTITLIEPFETAARMLPGVINLKVNRPELIGRIEFAGEDMPVLDPNEPMQLFVSQTTEKGTGIEAERQMLVYCGEETLWYLVGFFNSEAVIENLTANTEAEITLVTRFEAGQWVYGRDTVNVK